MQQADLFLVLSEIAGEHARTHDADAPPRVIPVLLNEVESRRDLLSHSAEFLGGVLLDVTSGHYSSPVAAYQDTELQSALETGLEVSRPTTRQRLRLSFSGGMVDAAFIREGGAAVVPTDADAEMLGVARALFDERLVRAELAFMLYSERAFDEFAQRALLETLTGLEAQDGMRIGGARTLVLFIQAQLSPRAHCQFRRGIRYSLSGQELVRRHAATHLRDTVRKLSVDRPEPVVFFLGAGFSLSSGMPVGNGLRDGAIRRLTEFDKEEAQSSIDLARHLYGWGQEDGRNLLSAGERALSREDFAESLTLEQVARMEKVFFQGREVPPVLEEFADIHARRLEAMQTDPLGSAVYDVRRIGEFGRRIVVATVNFDELIEVDEDLFDIAVEDADFTRLTPILTAMASGEPHPDRKVPLLKLHGTISRPETCIVTDDATRYGVSTPRRDALEALVTLDEGRETPWVYVGASMRDIDLNINVFSSQRFNKAASEWWVSPYYPEETVFKFVATKERRWAYQDLEKKLFERTVTETADAFFRALTEEWCSDGAEV